MSSSQPLIKIIPPNPESHSILIVYCYTNNKNIQCQAKWSRVQLNQQNSENKNNRSMNTVTGNTYKCTPLDCNHSILVQATCQYMGKTYKLTARTQPVKASKQLLERKSHRKTANCKISNSNLQIQCKITLDSNKTLTLSSGSRIFNLQLQSPHVYVLSSNNFKARILSRRFQFLTFFHQCQNERQTSTHNFQLSLANLFQFSFNSESDRDLVLYKISQITQFSNQKLYNFVNSSPKVITSYQQLPANKMNFLQKAQINIQLKPKDNHFQSINKKNFDTKRSNADKSLLDTHKKEFTLNFQTQNKSPLSSFLYYSPKGNPRQRKETGSETKKNQKIKISQKLSQKNQKDSFRDMNSKSHHDLKTKKQFHDSFEKSSLIFNQKDKQKIKKEEDKQFLNIFDEEEADSQPQIILQNSSPEFYKLGSIKNRSLTNFMENKINSQKKDLPSMNLRGSFDELEKIIEPPFIQKGNQKFKTQTCRQLSYQYPKSKQKPQLFNFQNSSTQKLSEDSLRKSINSLKKENQELKKQNLSLKKQYESFDQLSKENFNLKKKQLQMAQKINTIEKQMKEYLTEKLKYEVFYHKEKTQKESLRKQLQEVFQLIEKNSFQQLLKLTKEKKEVINKIDELQEEIFNKVGCQTLKNITHTKKQFNNNEGRTKTPPSKIYSQNQNLLVEQNKGLGSNSHSRKDLLFPNYSYKYSSNKNTTIT